jgi:hypothetical protein
MPVGAGAVMGMGESEEAHDPAVRSISTQAVKNIDYELESQRILMASWLDHVFLTDNANSAADSAGSR